MTTAVKTRMSTGVPKWALVAVGVTAALAIAIAVLALDVWRLPQRGEISDSFEELQSSVEFSQDSERDRLVDSAALTAQLRDAAAAAGEKDPENRAAWLYTAIVQPAYVQGGQIVDVGDATATMESRIELTPGGTPVAYTVRYEMRRQPDGSWRVTRLLDAEQLIERVKATHPAMKE